MQHDIDYYISHHLEMSQKGLVEAMAGLADHCQDDISTFATWFRLGFQLIHVFIWLSRYKDINQLPPCSPKSELSRMLFAPLSSTSGDHSDWTDQFPQVSCAEQLAPAGPKFCMTLKAHNCLCPASRESRSLEASQTEKLQQQNENGTRTRGRDCLVLRECCLVAGINNCTMFLRNIGGGSTAAEVISRIQRSTH